MFKYNMKVKSIFSSLCIISLNSEVYSQLKEKLPSTSAVPRSVVPFELTIWMVKRGFLGFSAHRRLPTGLVFGLMHAAAPSPSSSSSSSFPEGSAPAPWSPSVASWEMVSVLPHADWASSVLLPRSCSLLDSSSALSSPSLFGLASHWPLLCSSVWAVSGFSSSFFEGPTSFKSSSTSSAPTNQTLSEHEVMKFDRAFTHWNKTQRRTDRQDRKKRIWSEWFRIKLDSFRNVYF